MGNLIKMGSYIYCNTEEKPIYDELVKEF